MCVPVTDLHRVESYCASANLIGGESISKRVNHVWDRQVHICVLMAVRVARVGAAPWRLNITVCLWHDLSL